MPKEDPPKAKPFLNQLRITIKSVLVAMNHDCTSAEL